MADSKYAEVARKALARLMTALGAEYGPAAVVRCEEILTAAIEAAVKADRAERVVECMTCESGAAAVYCQACFDETLLFTSTVHERERCATKLEALAAEYDEQGKVLAVAVLVSAARRVREGE